jgi:hypothetical protein
MSDQPTTQELAQARAAALSGQQQQAQQMAGLGRMMALHPLLQQPARQLVADSQFQQGQVQQGQELLGRAGQFRASQLGEDLRQGAQFGQQEKLARLNNAAEWERLQATLGAKRDADAAEKAGKTAEHEEKLRKELNGLQVAKDTMSMSTAFRGIQQALGQNSAAGDMAGIFQFMKVLDPTSSVREGEYANAKNAAGVPDQVVNLYNQALSGKLLNPKQRQDFLGTAKGKYRSQLKEFKRYADAFGGLASQQGADPSRVVVGYDFSDLEDSQGTESAVAQPKTEAEYAALPSGAVYLGADGKPRRKK